MNIYHHFLVFLTIHLIVDQNKLIHLVYNQMKMIVRFSTIICSVCSHHEPDIIRIKIKNKKKI